MEFWGIQVSPGKPVEVNVDQGREVLHMTQVAFGADVPKDDKAVVKVGFDDTEFVIGTLQNGPCNHFQVDLVLDATCKLMHSGKTNVYFLGFWQKVVFSDDEDDDEEEDEEMDGEVDEAITKMVAKSKPPKAIQAKMQKGPQKAAQAAAEEDDDDDDDEDDDDDDGIMAMEGLVGDDDDDEDDDDDDEDEEDDDEEDDEEDDDDEDDDDDDDDEEDDDDESEEEEVPAKANGGAKRPLSAAHTPAKKMKPAPNSAPTTPAATKKAAVPTQPHTEKKAPASSTEEKAFEKQLADLLKKNGRMAMAAIGGTVKRPASVPKLKPFMDARPNLFKITGDQVQLAK